MSNLLADSGHPTVRDANLREQSERDSDIVITCDPAPRIAALVEPYARHPIYVTIARLSAIVDQSRRPF
jgi:hypothetical protein